MVFCVYSESKNVSDIFYLSNQSGSIPVNLTGRMETLSANQAHSDTYSCWFNRSKTPLAYEKLGMDWSPDGRSLVYVQGVGGDDALTVMRIGDLDNVSHSLTNIKDGNSNFGYDYRGVSWSPDGSSIAYTGKSGNDVEDNLYTVAADGKTYKSVTQISIPPRSPYLTSPKAWSTDSSLIAVYVDGYTGIVVGYPGAKIIALTKETLPNVFGTKKSLPELLASFTPTNPQISWFGPQKRIGFIGGSLECNCVALFSYDIAGDNLKIIYKDVLDAKVSPDGKRIAVTTFDTKSIKLVLLKEDGTFIRNLVVWPHSPLSFQERILDINWSPDQTKIAFTANITGTWKIYVVDDDGSNLSVLSKDIFALANPIWRPSQK